jgi:transglutaminase-like putative cysteine protease
MPFVTIRHITTCRYRRPVAFGEHRMMLHPCDSHDQRVIQADLKISPEPRSLHFVQDAFGNHVGIARFSRRSKELSFESVVCVEHSPRGSVVLEDGGRPFPVEYSVDELRILAPYVERQQHDPTDEVGRWARELLFPSGATGAFELLTRLSRSIHHGFIYRRREAKGVQLPIETLRLGHGSCRDFAMLMIDATRSIGFAARFASGYLAIPLDDPQAPTGCSGRGSTHAWAQIYLPGAGWIDFDPTSNAIGSVDLVTVAVVPDPRHAIPLHGTYVGFPSDHLGMEVQVSVTFDSRKGDLDPSATDANSTIGPMHAPRRNHRPPISHHGYPELETRAKRSQPAPAALPQAEGGA